MNTHHTWQHSLIRLFPLSVSQHTSWIWLTTGNLGYWDTSFMLDPLVLPVHSAALVSACIRHPLNFFTAVHILFISCIPRRFHLYICLRFCKLREAKRRQSVLYWPGVRGIETDRQTVHVPVTVALTFSGFESDPWPLLFVVTMNYPEKEGNPAEVKKFSVKKSGVRGLGPPEGSRRGEVPVLWSKITLGLSTNSASWWLSAALGREWDHHFWSIRSLWLGSVSGKWTKQKVGDYQHLWKRCLAQISPQGFIAGRVLGFWYLSKSSSQEAYWLSFLFTLNTYTTEALDPWPRMLTLSIQALPSSIQLEVHWPFFPPSL